MLPPAPRETLPSYLARFAASKGVTAAALAYDMGVSLKRMLDQDPLGIDRLVLWGGLSSEQVAELLSWTGEPMPGSVRTRFRGDIFVSRALRSPSVRGCPGCLREDARRSPAAPLKAMVMQGHWQLRDVQVCVKHSRPLAILWTEETTKARQDIGARMAEIFDDLVDGQFDLPIEDVSPFDRWLDLRLSESEDQTWLKNETLYAATTFCRLLGGELLRLSPTPEADRRLRLRRAQALGFEVARQGEVSIRAAFDQLAGAADGHLHEPSAAFGRLFDKLSQAYLQEEAFDRFRILLRACILDVWPIGAGEVLLGEPVAERRLHSVVTAAREASVSQGLMKQFLLEAGAISNDDSRPDSRMTFDAAKYAGLVSDIPGLVGPGAMHRAIGATKGELKALEEDGILTGRTLVPTTKSRWRLEDGFAFIAELEALAVSIVEAECGWEKIQQAKLRVGVSAGDIISAIRSGEVRLGRRRGVHGYQSFEVSKPEIDQWISLKMRPVNEECATTSVAAFGRSIGLRDGRRLEAMAQAGHIPCKQEWNPKTRRQQLVMTSEDVAEFHRKYLTTTTMTMEFGVHRLAALATLKAQGAKPFAPNGADYGNIYLRDDVEDHLRNSQG
ncbi:hypothetical protein FAZ78_04540 [Cereibacter changlensis]|uniref:TniQ domain-containing protein n=1 Tax=Cereibacter changlensis TaxID=402884 RepID=A0A4U0Z0N1_9RHOB|nr:TniQ family protein [Cereibacter changlensis]TKA97718.1 hypothetical protein FAZ78_04540 [Cereibacter changlensis]